MTTINEREIEIAQHAKVYLVWDWEGKAWAMDPRSVDGYALDGLYELDTDGLRVSDMTEEERAEYERADQARLPDAMELYDLLGDALGIPRRQG